MDRAEEILAFWFEGEPDRFRECWFKADPAFDAAIREAFEASVEAAATGRYRDWAGTPRGALALALLLDQFPRNLFRSSARAFATDEAARALAEQALREGFDEILHPVERMFLYLPFEHAENLADQERSVALFEALASCPGFARPNGPIAYARRHRAVIRLFGRFPHRNAALERVSPTAELAWLAAHESGF